MTAEFSAETVLAMLMLVEGSIGALGWYVARNTAREKDLKELKGRVRSLRKKVQELNHQLDGERS